MILLLSMEKNFSLEEKVQHKNIEKVSDLTERIKALTKEINDIKKYPFMNKDEILKKLRSIPKESIDEDDIEYINKKAYQNISYINYIEEISSFIELQKKLEYDEKSHIKIKKEPLNDPSEEFKDNHWIGKPPEGKYGKNIITISTSNSLPSSRNMTPIGRLYSLATKGIDPKDIVIQHEIIHHYQRFKSYGRFSLKILRFLLEDEIDERKILQKELQARLHHSMLGADWAYDNERTIEALSDKNYGLKNNKKDAVINMNNNLKKLYALNVSNRRIARLVNDMKSLKDKDILEQEIKKVMKERNISENELINLLSIDELERHIVNLRLKKFANEIIKIKT